MRHKIRQIFFDLRRQPLVSSVTIIGTAMSVFLIMIVAILARVKVAPYPPESCREQLLMGENIHVRSKDKESDASSPLSYSAAIKLYGNLRGVKRISVQQTSSNTIEAKGTTDKNFTSYSRTVDGEFFKIFDHPLIAGRYFTKEEADAGMPLAVITESTARKAFGKTECINHTILLNHKKYNVIGVVRDHSLSARTGSGEILMPLLKDTKGIQSMFDLFGEYSVAILVDDGTDFESVRNQVKARYAELDAILAKDDFETIYHGSPYDVETLASGELWSNDTPDPSGARNARYLLYAILFIVPAINLGNMLHSRMRRRINEIGIRRAYGCPRYRIISDIIWENFFVTLAGGVIGIVLGVIFALTYNGLYESVDYYGRNLTPDISSVINWTTVIIAVGVCFILNILSASVPAWMASRVNPVEAINAK